MSSVTKNRVIYYPASSGEYYFVGNNATRNTDGINDTSFTGAIVIEEKINGKSVLEIAQYAFQRSLITSVTIHAKLRSINYHAFCWCQNIEYMNIPSSVTFIGGSALHFCPSNQATLSKSTLIEFNEGRTLDLYIQRCCFTCRSIIHIIYPSEKVPTYNSNGAFYATTTAVICAPKTFTFYTKPTTTSSSCPLSRYKEASKLKSIKCKLFCIKNRRERCFIISCLLISLFTKRIS